MDIPTFTESLKAALQNEAVVGFGLFMLVGWISYLLRSIPVEIFNGLTHFSSISLVITRNFMEYELANKWINQHPMIHRTRKREIGEAQLDGTSAAGVTAGLGRHFILYRGRLVVVHRDRNEDKAIHGFPFEKLTFTFYTFSNAVVDSFLQELEKLRNRGDAVDIFTASSGHWDLAARRNLRPKESVLLDDEIKDDLFEDVEWFLNSQEWYHQRGVPYYRGYMLHGPPGNGKTSLVMALASHFNLPIYYINLNNESDETLAASISNAASPSIILFEDVDSVDSLHDRGGGFVTDSDKKERLNYRDPHEYRNHQQQAEGEDDSPEANSGKLEVDIKRLTLSGILNSLDGILSPEGHIRIFTTNHPDVFDPAFMRPGRIDRKVLVDYPGYDEVRAMFLRFFNDEKTADRFASDIISQPWAVKASEVQELLVRFSHDPQQALNNIEQLKESA